MTEFLAKLASTNYRIFVTMLLTSLVIVTVCGGLILEKHIDNGTLTATYVFLAAMAGVDYLQFSKKRDTYQPSPPSPPDIEDGPAQTEVKP